MRILSVVGRSYGGKVKATEPMFLEFRDPLIDLGHTVEHFDHDEIGRRAGADACGGRFVQTVRNGAYDLVLYQTAGRDLMPREAIREAGRFAPIVAWNSDDDWQWEGYTSSLAPYFTFMVTTYPHIFEANRATVPNLRLSQWGCYDRLADFGRKKDLAFSFVGRVYGARYADCRFLHRKAGLRVFGSGSRLVSLGIPPFRGCSRIPGLMGPPILEYADVNAVWNRTCVSYTPLGSSADPRLLQVKGRVFQMGLSGTLMLCDEHPEIERYYDPGREYVTFCGVDECADKARYYLAHEGERARIAQAYHDRTRAAHTWQRRFARLFEDIGIHAAGGVM
jgi:spore maturation protein CgeB